MSVRETLEELRISARDQLSAAWQLQAARLEELLATGWTDNLERVIEERFSETMGRLEEAFAAELDARTSDVRRELRRELADRLNQSLRRLRMSESEDDLHRGLLDSSGAYCRRAVLFRVADQTLRCAG